MSLLHLLWIVPVVALICYLAFFRLFTGYWFKLPRGWPFR